MEEGRPSTCPSSDTEADVTAGVVIGYAGRKGRDEVAARAVRLGLTTKERTCRAAPLPDPIPDPRRIEKTKETRDVTPIPTGRGIRIGGRDDRVRHLAERCGRRTP